MTKFIAYVPLDNSDLPELQLLRPSIKGTIPVDVDAQGFDINQGSVIIQAEGSRLKYSDGVPHSGTVKIINVSVDGFDQYSISDADMRIPKDVLHYFSPSKKYEKNFIFHNDDSIFGSSGDDTLIGYSGADLIKGHAGDDYLSGVRGRDRLFGGDGDDRLYGGASDDILDGGGGINTSSGDSGKDRFRFSSELDSDNFTEIRAFQPMDRIELVADAFRGIGRHGKLAADKFLHTNEYDGETHVIVYDRPTGTLSYATGPDTLIAFGSVHDKLDLRPGDIFVV